MHIHWGNISRIMNYFPHFVGVFNGLGVAFFLGLVLTGWGNGLLASLPPCESALYI